MSPDEQRLFRLYGKLPNKTDLLQNKLKVCLPVRTVLRPRRRACPHPLKPRQ